MTKLGIGQGVPRWEDPRLLRGGGRYSDDLNRPGQAYGYVLRSPHANAKIAAIDTSAAADTPGVLGVWTGEDYAASGLGNIPCAVPRQRADGSPMFVPPNAALRKDAVKMVGDPVCWLDHVCPECGAFNDDPGSPCWRCGTTDAGDATG